MSVMNPVVRIKDQFLDSYSMQEVRNYGKKVLIDAMAAYLQELELPADVLNAYPHQLSGGMRQRVIVALATFVQPKFVIADEPTTALDVVVQRGILTMLRSLQKKAGNTFVMVSHDMGVHYQITDRMVIMYAGKVVEYGSVEDIFYRPKHHYTKGLLASVPHFESGKRLSRLETIPGIVPNLTDLPDGCRFQERCVRVQPKCKVDEPKLVELAKNHFSACHFPSETPRVGGPNV